MDEDTELIRRHLAGDGEATRALVTRHEDGVYAIAWRMLESPEEAREASQDVFLKALEALTRFRGDAAFKTWLYRIAVNTCITRAQERRRRGATISLDDTPWEPAAEGATAQEALERAEDDARLRRAVSSLREEYRAAIVLRYFEGLSYEETALAMGIPVGTVKVRLHRAKRLLLKKLKTAHRRADGRASC